MTSISVVIPAYNEEKAIGPVLRRLKALPLSLDVIVVDDGSTDDTALRAEGFGVRVLRHPANGGYGLALKSGIRAAMNDLIAIVDADETYPIEDLPALVAAMGEGFDMVVGARQGREYWGTYFKVPARLVFKFLVEFSTGRRIPDINSGFRLFRRRDIEPLFPLLCNTFSFTTSLTLAYCFLHKFIAYRPISYGKRIGRAKVRFVRDSLRTFQYIIESIAYFNPIKLFVLLTGFLLLLATLSIAGAWLGASSFLLGTAALFLVSSFLTFGIGLLSVPDAVARKRAGWPNVFGRSSDRLVQEMKDQHEYREVSPVPGHGKQ